MGAFHFRRLPAILLLFLILLPSAVPDIDSEREALIAFREAVGSNMLTWDLTSHSPCKWSGVHCSQDGTAVIDLRLPGKQLFGQIPASTLSNLTNLQSLSLHHNSFSGQLPADIFSRLHSLRRINLQHNQFSGQIPDSVFSLTSLVILHLAGNRFSGSIPDRFNSLTGLETLQLQENEFTGPIPDLRLPSLVQMNVSHNNLTGKIPTGLSRLPKSSFWGNSVCGKPLDSCGDENSNPNPNPERKRKNISVLAIAGLAIGAVLGFLLILLIVICLCRKSKANSKVEAKGKELDTPQESSRDFTEGKGTSEGNLALNVGNKRLVVCGNSDLNYILEDLLAASAEVLGKGMHGMTYKAILQSGVMVVVKRVRDGYGGERGFREGLEEIGKLEYHENLVPLRAYFCGGTENLLVYDYMPMGCLCGALHGNKRVSSMIPLKWKSRLAIARGTARGILYLHLQGPSVCHGNIKSSNILLTTAHHACVSDFGLMQLTGSFCVASYCAPEVTDPTKISQKADVYSFGVVLMELLTGKENVVDLPKWVISVMHKEWISQVFDPELNGHHLDMMQLLQVAVDCTTPCPDERPAMIEVTGKIEEIFIQTLRMSTNDGVTGVEDKPPGVHLRSPTT